MASFFRLGAPEKQKPTQLSKEHSSANLVGALERHGMSGALESTPTATMRQELAAAGVELPVGEELTALSRSLNEWIEELRRSKNLEAAHSWFNLFKEIDEDGSGFVTYDELCDVVRQKMKKGASVLSDDALKALWCALDVDNSNSVMQDEMASFFRLGAPEKKKLVKGPKEHSSASLVGSLERHGMSAVLESTPTATMRQELAAADVTRCCTRAQPTARRALNAHSSHST